MNKYKILNKFIIKIFIIFFINFFMVKYFGNLYLKKLNTFIKENNSLVIKKELNNIIKNNKVKYNEKIYHIEYNSNNEIINLNMDINNVNSYLSSFIDLIDKSITKLKYDYLDNYYKYFQSKKGNKYYLLPLGMVSDNPFIYNTGPKVIVSYDSLCVSVLKIEINIKNYGLNSALIETYLNVHIDQNIFKPILYNISSYDYKFLISSNIINGRVANYLGTSLSFESKSISNI